MHLPVSSRALFILSMKDSSREQTVAWNDMLAVRDWVPEPCEYIRSDAFLLPARITQFPIRQFLRSIILSLCVHLLWQYTQNNMIVKERMFKKESYTRLAKNTFWVSNRS